MASKPPEADKGGYDRPDRDRPEKPDKEKKERKETGDWAGECKVRATGDGQKTIFLGRDGGTSVATGEKSNREKFVDAFVSELDKAKSENHRLTRADKQAIARLAWDRLQESTNSLDWFGMDDLEYSRDSIGPGERAVQFAEGLQSLWDRYQDMKASNTKGADRYFHCLAHCEAASKGPGGQLASKIIGQAREVADLQKYTGKIGSVGAKVDGFADTFINREGYRGGTSGVRCYDHCGRFKPNGL